MSKKQLTLCDVCGEEVSWLDGAHLIMREATFAAPKAYPNSGTKELDLCNFHWKPFVELLALLGVDAEGERAEQNRRCSETNQGQA